MDIKKAAQAIKDADAILITAGAGMGVDSGLPDFRGRDGFWRAYPHAKKLGLDFHDLASPGWFENNPRLAWAFYGHRLNLYRDTAPHKGYHILLDLAARKRYGAFAVTSNVDGHFQKAGFSPDAVLEVHGSIHHLQCSGGCQGLWSSDSVQIDVDMERFEATGILPKCPGCGAVARPNILMFGDYGWVPDRLYAQQTRYLEWEKQIQAAGAKAVIIEIGAGNAVPTIRMISQESAKKLSATLIRINPRDTDVPAGHISLQMTGLAALKALIA